MEAAGPFQLCASQISGTEAAIHSMRSVFQSEDTKAVLLVDASNAFNNLNRSSALLNIQYICPSFATILSNCYRSPTDLFIDGSTLLSADGTTQGDPLAMPMYALATVPLIKKLRSVPQITQIGYADDASTAGSLEATHRWWCLLNEIGPQFGYFPNSSKTWLVVKEDVLAEATCLFSGSGVQITTEGRPHLGAPLGCHNYVQQFILSKVECWKESLKLYQRLLKPNHILHMQPTSMVCLDGGNFSAIQLLRLVPY